MKRTYTIAAVILILIGSWLIFANQAKAKGYTDHKAGLARGGMWNLWPFSVPYRAGSARASAEIAASQAATPSGSR